MRSFTAIAIASVFFSTNLPAQVVRSVLGVSEEQVEGELNWTERTLTVYGEGVAPSGMTDVAQRRLMGFRDARTVAYRNLLDIVGEVHVDSRTTGSMAMVTMLNDWATPVASRMATEPPNHRDPANTSSPRCQATAVTSRSLPGLLRPLRVAMARDPTSALAA